MTAKLWCFGESGNSYKAALMLALTEYAWEPVFVDFFNGAARTDDFREFNNFGELPVFQEGDLKLTQSAVIMLHIADRTGKFSPDRTEALRWMFWDNHKLSGVAGNTRFLQNFLPEAKRPQEVIAFQHGRLKAAYQILNQHLEGRDWIVADTPSIADFSCCGYLYYPEPFGFDRKEWSNIDRWLDGIAALPGWKHPYDLMPGSPADRA